MSPVLSIVTVSFNQAQYLRQAIDSVLSQKTDDVEYIVVDPGSTDGSREILASYGRAIDHLILEPDTGPADGLNKGFARATGRYGYFLNSDDFLLPGSIARIISYWKTYKSHDVLLCSAWMVNGVGEPLRQLRSTKVTVTGLLTGSSVMVQQGMSFSMETFRQSGGFDSKNNSCWDLELLFDFARAGAAIIHLPDRIGAFRIYDESISGGVGGDKHFVRYKQDLNRICLSATGQNLPKGPAEEVLARVRKYLISPGLGFLRLQELLFPFTIKRRWHSDNKVMRIE